MKKGILSISFALIGIYLVYWNNQQLYHIITTINIENTTIQNTYSLNPILFQKTYQITTVCIGLLGLYFGIISFTKKNKIGILGILLSILLICISNISFWEYFVNNDMLPNTTIAE